MDVILPIKQRARTAECILCLVQDPIATVTRAFCRAWVRVTIHTESQVKSRCFDNCWSESEPRFIVEFSRINYFFVTLMQTSEQNLAVILIVFD